MRLFRVSGAPRHAPHPRRNRPVKNNLTAARKTMGTRHGNHAVVLQFTQIVNKRHRTPRSYINFDATAAKGGHGIKGGLGECDGF